MISYRFRRRSFLAALGGGFGLRAMFQNAELAAQTGQSPPRFLFTHWPLGIVAGASDALWTPTSGAAGGYALQTFADNGLADDMITLRYANTSALQLNGGGGGEGGMVLMVTGVDCGGTRANRGESDDAFAAGPSIDQHLLAKVPGLRAPAGGPGFANALCDARTDLGEISSKCLSYSNDRQPVTLYSGETGTENIPLMGTLSPFGQYTVLFSGMAPGTGAGGAGGTGAGPAADGMLKQLAMKRSVLDFSLAELARMKALVPGSARNRLQIHADAVAEVEAGLSNAIRTRYPTATGAGGNGGGVGGAGGTNPRPQGCLSALAPPPAVQGPPDWTTGGHGNYGNPKNGSTDDMANHAQVGQLHMDVLRAAFVCDVIRCGTFQWSPTTNHVGFKGLYPGDEAGIYQHHPTSHALGAAMSSLRQARTPDELVSGARFLFNVQTWYFARHAENLKRWKDAVDGVGNPLLDTTIIPFATEIADLVNSRTGIPSMLFGGKKLGMNTGQYVPGVNTVNNLFGTLAQAFGVTATAAPFGTPIPGLWSPPTGR